MLYRPLAVIAVTFFLAACDSSGAPEQVNNALSLGQARSAQCQVVAPRIGQARAQFTQQCGGNPRDCDPVTGGWMCASYVIGSSAPTPDASQVEPIANPQASTGSCTVRGASLSQAMQAYSAQCALPRRDCDPVDGQWQCSSHQLGSQPSGNPDSVTGLPAPVVHDDSLDGRVRTLVQAASGGRGLTAFTLPHSDDLASIPQDPLNPLTPAKVALGKLLFHDTSFALDGRLDDTQSWSCATCHHAAAGFKAGARQGIGNGGHGFGDNGTARALRGNFNVQAGADDPDRADVQPIASPTILNTAWQDVMLWNGQFGNSSSGIVNAGVDPGRLATPGTPKAVNDTGLSGLEVQAIAGSGVHRLKFSDNTPLQTDETYQRLWLDAYGSESIDTLEGAAKAMAAFERTVTAYKAPFQQWLRGDAEAMNDTQLRGAALFFGSAGCVDCHRGPGLGSDVGAMADDMFMALGFNDLDSNNPSLVGVVDQATRLGRGGFTGDSSDNYQFKIPQLYNLADASVLGHGGSFTTVREVIEYKNRAEPQNPDAQQSLDHRFVPLSLSDQDIDDLTAFLVEALRDPDLLRYQPESVPGGGCVIVNSGSTVDDNRCP